MWGLPCLRHYCRSGALLPHLFTLTTAWGSPLDKSVWDPWMLFQRAAQQWRYVFCGTGRPRALTPASRTLSGTLPCGVRTFLSRQPPLAQGSPAATARSSCQCLVYREIGFTSCGRGSWRGDIFTCDVDSRLSRISTALNRILPHVRTRADNNSLRLRRQICPSETTLSARSDERAPNSVNSTRIWNFEVRRRKTIRHSRSSPKAMMLYEIALYRARVRTCFKSSATAMTSSEHSF